MPTARLHDDAPIEVTVLGDGPAVLLPVRTRVIEGQEAEQMLAWGADPALGHRLVTGLAAAGFRVIAADYEGHLAEHPKPRTLNASTLATDLLAIADAGGAEGGFAYYGYSWLALAGLQLSVRTDRLTALAMGGFPPLGGPYAAMLEVTRATYRAAVANAENPPAPSAAPEPGDWDSADLTLSPDQTRQYLSLYESLQSFDDAAAELPPIPRLAFAGERDTIVYGPKWGNAVVDLAGPLTTRRAELAARGWRVEVVPAADHMSAMQAAVVLPLLTGWLAAEL
ncbi:alpha/beta hydrolase [Actinoplanes sp. NPDC026619]|uniref:alpha/beta fold hydrolase n=1 Tax=Actinoplanes sp. NPDC026619 TaxID=3155798 RepID=UPI0033F5C4D6